MKRYLVFVGSNYYPGGGMNDYVGSFDSLSAAHSAITRLEDEDWGHIWDSRVEEITEDWERRTRRGDAEIGEIVGTWEKS